MQVFQIVEVFVSATLTRWMSQVRILYSLPNVKVFEHSTKEFSIRYFKSGLDTGLVRSTRLLGSRVGRSSNSSFQEQKRGPGHHASGKSAARRKGASQRYSEIALFSHIFSGQRISANGPKSSNPI